MRKAGANDGGMVLAASEPMVTDFLRPGGTTAQPQPGVVNLFKYQEPKLSLF